MFPIFSRSHPGRRLLRSRWCPEFGRTPRNRVHRGANGLRRKEPDGADGRIHPDGDNTPGRSNRSARTGCRTLTERRQFSPASVCLQEGIRRLEAGSIPTPYRNLPQIAGEAVRPRNPQEPQSVNPAALVTVILHGRPARSAAAVTLESLLGCTVPTSIPPVSANRLTVT
jgi:hypothetical protein